MVIWQRIDDPFVTQNPKGFCASHFLGRILGCAYTIRSNLNFLHNYQGKRCGSNEEVISETEAYFKAKDKLFYKKKHRIVREALESVYHPRRTLC